MALLPRDLLKSAGGTSAPTLDTQGVRAGRYYGSGVYGPNQGPESLVNMQGVDVGDLTDPADVATDATGADQLEDGQV